MVKFAFWPDWYIADEREDLLGAGSFGRVYRICRDDLGLQTVSALKVIRVPHDASEVQELRDRSMDDRSIAAYYDQTAQEIAEEIKLLLTLKYCPNIITIEDYHIERNADGIGFTVYIRMPLLKSLEDCARARMKSGQMFSGAEVVKIGSDICDALTACEGKNIIHRDIKPANIFVDEFGTYMLGDFGIAKQMDSATQSMHSQKGTMNYMAPEVLRGEAGYDRTVDLYSLGTMLYRYMNHNRFPFEPRYPQPISPADSSSVLMKRLSGAEVPMPDDVPTTALGEAIRKACAADPKARYRSAAEMKDALQRGLAGEYVQANAQMYGSGTIYGDGSTEGAWSGGKAFMRSGSDLTDDDSSTIGAMDQDLWLQEQKRLEEEKRRREEQRKAEARRREEERRRKAEEDRRREEERRKAEEEQKRKDAAASRLAAEQQRMAKIVENQAAQKASGDSRKKNEGGTGKKILGWVAGLVIMFIAFNFGKIAGGLFAGGYSSSSSATASSTSTAEASEEISPEGLALWSAVADDRFAHAEAFLQGEGSFLATESLEEIGARMKAEGYRFIPAFGTFEQQEEVAVIEEENARTLQFIMENSTGGFAIRDNLKTGARQISYGGTASSVTGTPAAPSEYTEWLVQGLWNVRADAVRDELLSGYSYGESVLGDEFKCLWNDNDGTYITYTPGTGDESTSLYMDQKEQNISMEYMWNSATGEMRYRMCAFPKE